MIFSGQEFPLKTYLSYVRRIVELDSFVYLTKIPVYRCNLTKRYYEDRINVVNIKTLFHSRLLADITLTYNILNGLVDVDAIYIFDLYINNCRWPKVKI